MIKMKKIKVLTIMGIFLVSAMIFSTPATVVAVAPEAAVNEDYLLVGTTSLGYDLDPQFSWDSASSDINNQIWEGLFAYDLGDPSLRVIPVLAAECGVWSDDGLHFNVPLRENVTYSNGDPFNASCVVDSFQRLGDLCVYEGDQVGELYFPFGMNKTLAEDPDGVTNSSNDYGYIIDDISVVDNYNITFNLNYKYVPFEAVLCFSASFIMHPNAPTHADNEGNAYLDYANVTNNPAIVVGTGPYTLEEHTTEQVVFEFNPNYHRGTPAIRKFKYLKYLSSDTLAVALLDQTLDYGGWSADFLQDMRDAEHMVVGAKRPNTIISYLGYNNKQIDIVMRTAMNLAIDYDYIIDEIINGQATRMTSIVPPGILYHIDCDVPEEDISASRQNLIDNVEDFTVDFELDETSLDADWIAVAEGNSPVASYSYTYDLGNIVREEIGAAIKSDFAKIGIRINICGVSWSQYLSKLYDNKNTLELFIIESMADYNDPSNYINFFLSNTSYKNSAQVNDPYLQGLIKNGTQETDTAKRKEIYQDMQHYIAEDLQPWAFMSVGWSQSAYPETTHPQRNTMGYQYVFPWGWKDTDTIFTDLYLESWCNEGAPAVRDYWPDITGPMTDTGAIARLGLVAVIAISCCCTCFKKE